MPVAMKLQSGVFKLRPSARASKRKRRTRSTIAGPGYDMVKPGRWVRESNISGMCGDAKSPITSLTAVAQVTRTA